MLQNIFMRYARFFVFILSFIMLFSVCVYAKSRSDLYTTWHSSFIAMDMTPKHENAKFLPYANPKAKKGGDFKTMGLGGFDSLDLFVLKGSKADLLDLVYDTLMAQSYDEPYAIYPLIAEKVSIANDNNGVRFRINPKARFQR